MQFHLPHPSPCFSKRLLHRGCVQQSHTIICTFLSRRDSENIIITNQIDQCWVVQCSVVLCSFVRSFAPSVCAHKCAAASQFGGLVIFQIELRTIVPVNNYFFVLSDHNSIELYFFAAIIYSNCCCQLIWWLGNMSNRTTHYRACKQLIFVLSDHNSIELYFLQQSSIVIAAAS